ncbi:hypothetical protein [Phormidesmis priestleyi]
MRELKTESQSIRTTQMQPGLKKSNPRTVEDGVEQPELKAALDSETAPSLEEAPAKRGRKTSKQTAPKTPRSTTPKAKQTASTQVKLTWEAAASSERTPFGIAVRFQQLEHELTQLKSQANQISQQSVEIQTEMQALRTVAQQSALAASPEIIQSRKTGPSIPSFMKSPAPHLQPVNSEIPPAPQPVSQTSTRHSQPVSSEVSSPPKPSSQKPLTASTRATLKSIKNNSSPSRRRRSLRHALHRFAPSLELPQKPIARLLDALLWTLAAAGLRIGLNFLVGMIPFLAMPIGLLMFGPAIAAAYLGFFVPRSSPGLLYRLLLVTFGLLIGGKL